MMMPSGETLRISSLIRHHAGGRMDLGVHGRSVAGVAACGVVVLGLGEIPRCVGPEGLPKERTLERGVTAGPSRSCMNAGS